MPIYKGIKDTVNLAQLQFGHGDIRVAHGVTENAGVVCFFENEKAEPIGTKVILPTPVEVPLEDTPVRMVFDSIKSIDVVIAALHDARLAMVAKEMESVSPMEKVEEI